MKTTLQMNPACVDRLTAEEYYMFPELDIEPFGYISIRVCELYVELDKEIREWNN